MAVTCPRDLGAISARSRRDLGAISALIPARSRRDLGAIPAQVDTTGTMRDLGVRCTYTYEWAAVENESGDEGARALCVTLV